MVTAPLRERRRGRWQRRRIRVTLLLTAAGMALAVAACGSGSGSTSFNLSSLKVGFSGTLDTINVPDVRWMRQVHAQVVTLHENQTVVQAVSQGLVDLGEAQFTDVAEAAAQKQLQNVRILYVGDKTIPFIVVARPGITSIKALAGKSLAYNSAGSLTQVLPQLLVRQDDPAVMPKIHWVVIPDSSNRATALRAGRIDAAVLDYADLEALRNQGVKLSVLGVWPDLQGQATAAINDVWIVRKAVLDAHPGAMLALVQRIQEAYNWFYSDKTGWITLAKQALGVSYPESVWSATYDYYTKLSEYPKAGTPPITPQSLAAMNSFFVAHGLYGKPLAPNWVAFNLIAHGSRPGS